MCSPIYAMLNCLTWWAFPQDHQFMKLCRNAGGSLFTRLLETLIRGLYRLCRKKNTIWQSDRFAYTNSGRPPTVIRQGRRKTVEVCVELTFQDGSQNKGGMTCNDISCNIIRNLNLVHIIMDPRRSLPLSRSDIESHEKHYVCKNPYLNRKHSTEHGNARRYRYIYRFLAYDRQMGVAKFTHYTEVVFYAIGSLFCYFIGIFTGSIF